MVDPAPYAPETEIPGLPVPPPPPPRVPVTKPTGVNVGQAGLDTVTSTGPVPDIHGDSHGPGTVTDPVSSGETGTGSGVVLVIIHDGVVECRGGDAVVVNLDTLDSNTPEQLLALLKDVSRTSPLLDRDWVAEQVTAALRRSVNV